MLLGANKILSTFSSVNPLKYSGLNDVGEEDEHSTEFS